MVKEQIKGIVNTVSGIKEHNGTIQIGWTLKENASKWYNQGGEEADLKVLLKEIILKGNEIQFSYDGLSREVSALVKTKEAEAGQKSWEDDIVDFETLLTAAHDKGAPFSIKTEMLQLDLEKKFALFKATVEVYATAEQYTKYCIGEVSEESRHHKRMKLVEFTGHGDVTSENVTGEFIKPHFIRMAETRAIVRALRWYTNNAKCSEEEKSESKTEEEKESEQLGETESGVPTGASGVIPEQNSESDY